MRKVGAHADAIIAQRLQNECGDQGADQYDLDDIDTQSKCYESSKRYERLDDAPVDAEPLGCLLEMVHLLTKLQNYKDKKLQRYKVTK